MNNDFDKQDSAQQARDAGQPTGGLVPQFAIVELMGHVRLGGQISEVEFGGSKMIRLDIPQRAGGYATQFIGGSSVYRISFCDELTAAAAAYGESTRPPVKEYELTAELEARGIAVVRPDALPEPESDYPDCPQPSDAGPEDYDPFSPF